MYSYRYTGRFSTVFISLQKDGHTWVPSTGDTIDWPTPIGHPLLELIVPEETDKKSVKADAPVVQEPTETAVDEATPDTLRSDS